MAALTYFLCALTCLAAFGLLLRSWLASRYRLLFWSAMCFAALSVNNILLVVDKLVLPQVDLSIPRLIAALTGVLLLLFGLIWEEE
jgi:hydrogenase/urease accessory protein HupE